MYYLIACILLLGCQSTTAAAAGADVAGPPALNRQAQVIVAAPTAEPAQEVLAAQGNAAGQLPKGQLALAGRNIPVDIADTFETRRQGLSGRKSMGENTGLILAWAKPETVSIWMPDMNFPIDVIFVAGGKVVGVYADEPPCDPQNPCPDFGPTTPVDFVIEVPAGSAAKWGVKLGAPASFTQ
jgi:uncharacterized membrane protein (UPF0127 family)